MLNALRSKGSNVFVWIIIGLLIVGLANFGIGSSGGGTATTPIAEVGQEPVSVDEYVRAINIQRRALSSQFGRQLTMAEMQSLGLDRGVLRGLIDEATLNNEAAQAGLSAAVSATRFPRN